MREQIISSKLDDLLRKNREEIIFCGCENWLHCMCKDKYITQSLLQKYLREKYNIFVQVEVDQTMEPKFVYKISRFVEDEKGFEWINTAYSNFYNTSSSYSDLYYTYEDALEDGLEEVLNLLYKK